MQTAPTVKTSVFEGPLDLLLELIEKRKLLINDISLAAVTEEYIARLNAQEKLPVGETAEFVSLAATLLLIKSRSLLPTLTLSDDESRDIKELEYRLAVYQLVKEASRGLARQSTTAYSYEGRGMELEPLYIPDASATQSTLLAAAHTLIAGFPQMLTLPKVSVKKIVSLEEMIEKLAARVTAAMRLSFKEFTGKGATSKPEIIVGFLALLELVKQGIINATQQDSHGDITLEQSSVSTPTYE
jgi:segregation and condensation protein A